MFVLRLAIVAAVTLACATSSAAPFGGFSADETSYLVGTDWICTPIAGDVGEPRCAKADARKRAQAGFKKPTALRGSGAFVASASGPTVELKSADGSVRRSWQAPGVVSRIKGVYLSPNARMVAVEVETRTMGRAAVETVAFAIAKVGHAATSGAGTASGVVGQVGSGASGKLAVAPVARPKALQKAIDAGQGDLRKRRYRKALATFDGLVAKHPRDPAVRFGRAAARAGLGDRKGALADLRELGMGNEADTPVWLVEARTEPAFDGLRAEREFRMILGLDPGGRVLTAYERALALGGGWEQPGSPCAEPKVELRLGHPKQTFSLVITSVCDGVRDKTRLSGRWIADVLDVVTLIFPNPGQDDETLVCKLRGCQDGGETCLDCGAGTDMGFVLRPVSR